MNTALSHAAMCERIVEGAQSGIVLADHRGIIRMWNPGAVAMFGYTAEEAIGQPLDIIVPERHRARHNQGYERAMASGETRYGREVLAVPARRKDGTQISIEFTVTLLRSGHDEVLGAAAIIQDVTARWQRDKALRARLAALQEEVARLQLPEAAGHK